MCRGVGLHVFMHGHGWWAAYIDIMYIYTCIYVHICVYMYGGIYRILSKNSSPSAILFIPILMVAK